MRQEIRWEIWIFCSLHYQTLLLGSAGLISNGGWGWFSEDEWIQLEDEVFISAGHICWFLPLTSCQNVPGYYSGSLYRPFARTRAALGVTFLLLSDSLSGGDQSGNPGIGWLLNNNTILYNSPSNLFFFLFLSFEQSLSNNKVPESFFPYYSYLIV